MRVTINLRLINWGSRVPVIGVLSGFGSPLMEDSHWFTFPLMGFAVNWGSR